MIVTYFSRMIYRGDSTIDSRTAKIHTQRRLGHNFRCLGNVMHSCCEIGERLLKTEAKKISRTAQQRGNTEDEHDNSYLLPAQCLAFYRKDDQLLSVVHSVDIASDGKVSGYTNSVLTTHYNMQYSRSGSPSVYSINCASIDSTLMGIFHNPSSQPFDTLTKGIMIVRPRNEWSYAWIQWNRHLVAKNVIRSASKPFVDLGSPDMVNTIRKMIATSIREHGNYKDLRH
jgi:hypothetical protein